MTVAEKVAYIKGMFDGMALDTETSKEAKLLGAIIDVLEEVSLNLEDIEGDIEVLAEEIEAISDDLEVVEEELFEDDYDYEDEDEDDYDEDDDFFEVECPNCEEELVIDASVLEAGVIQCPNCEERFAIDLSDECDCGCCGEEE